MESKSNTNTFVKITNNDVYCKLLDLEKKIGDFHLTNMEQHNNIIKRQDFTNGKVKKGMWMATTAITITLMCLGFLFQHISKWVVGI